VRAYLSVYEKQTTGNVNALVIAVEELFKYFVPVVLLGFFFFAEIFQFSLDHIALVSGFVLCPE